MRRQSKSNATKTRSRKPAAIKRRGATASRHHSDDRSNQSIDQLRRELDEALEQQSATSQVLSIISSSPAELEPVFQAILANATRLCGATFGTLNLCVGEALRYAAHYNIPPKYRDFRLRERLWRPHPRSATAEALRTKQPVQIDDLRTLPDRLQGTHSRAVVDMGGARTLIVMPMLKDDKLIGTIVIFRQEVHPFTDKQIALVQNFAAQAVIAVENARLLNELRQRTTDLAESLEQQTATSQVLNIISSSPTELEPVFQAILANATRLCGAKFAGLSLYDGEAPRFVASYNVPPEYADMRLRRRSWRPHPRSGVAEVIRTKRPVQIDDIRTSPPYLEGDSTAKDLADAGGARTLILIPMLKDDKLIGLIAIYRQEVRPFTDKQIALLQNFAAQAVIAIENARLLDDLNKLNQQLEHRVADQVGEIERMGRLRRFLPPQVADLIVASGMEKQLESHRREITALFCDLRGFTGFSESSDPEDVMALLRDYHAAIGEIIVKYSGTLERFAGDGVMVIFNDPVPVENPALQAVLMALDMRAAIGGMIEKWRDLGHDLGFGIGIAHGFATLGTIGFEGRFDYAAIGTVSNVASRLCDEAKPGQILIAPRVRQAVEKAVAVEPVEEFTLKGIRRPMMTYNVLEPLPSKPN